MNTLTNYVTDKEINEAFEAIGCDVQVSGEYGEPERFTVTNDSIIDFINQSFSWNKYDKLENDESHCIFSNVQVKKGDQMHDLYVIDFGNIRICCKY